MLILLWLLVGALGAFLAFREVIIFNRYLNEQYPRTNKDYSEMCPSLIHLIPMTALILVGPLALFIGGVMFITRMCDGCTPSYMIKNSKPKSDRAWFHRPICNLKKDYY